MIVSKNNANNLQITTVTIFILGDWFRFGLVWLDFFGLARFSSSPVLFFQF
jgi:hypothetical protein